MKGSRAELFMASSPREAWDGAMAAWFDRVVPGAWKSELPALVITPTRGHANAIRTRLLARGSSHLGLRFLTPAGLRELFARADPAPRAAPEDLRLLLAIAAGEIENQPGDSD